MSLSRRGFIAVCSTLVVPYEPQCIYSFANPKKIGRIAFDYETRPLPPLDPEMIREAEKVNRQIRKILQFGAMYGGEWRTYDHR